MSARPEPQWERLAEHVRAQRGQRTQKAVTAAGGPSDTTIGKIETARWRPSRGGDDTLQKLDIGLGWRAGSSAAILAGGSPDEKSTEAPINLRDVSDGELIAELATRLAARRSDRRVARDESENLPNWGSGFRAPAAGEDSRVSRYQ
jgi:hypothetical protein